MSRYISFRWAWIAFAAGLVCVPIRAQSYWSSIDIDAYGNITGASVTEVPWYYLTYGFEAYAEGLLNNASGGEIMDVEAYDDGSGYAEADTYGTASAAGSYTQNGDHDVDAYGEPYEFLGSSEDSADWTESCLIPEGESTTFASPPWKDSGSGSTEASYLVNVYDEVGDSFNGRGAREKDGGGGSDTCYAIYTGGYSSSSGVIPTATFTIGMTYGYNYYGDYVGYMSPYVSTLQSTYASQLPCGFVVYQVMQILCPDGSYQTWTTDVHTATVEANGIQDCRAYVCETQGDFE